MALLPWVIVPLVSGSRWGSARRAAMRSGVAVLCMGGVNAAANLAVLPLPLLFLLTRGSGPRKRALTGWWLLAVLLASLWWLLPLALLGRYSPPFLDWIENAHITTTATSLVESLRGNSNWLALLTGPFGPQRPAGWWLATTPLAVVDTALVAALGLYGLARRDLPERRWLVLGLLAGLVGVTFGHLGALAPPVAGFENHLLDGVLAAFRNVHKFQPMVTLPLVLAAGHVVGLLTSAAVGRTSSQVFPRPAALGSLALVVLVGAGMAMPALKGSLAPPGAYQSVPAYEQQAADWLGQHSGQGSVLVVPGSSFAELTWGTTQDDPLQALGKVDWAVRSAVPLTPAGTIRMLDAVQQRLATGTGSDGLATYLARAGVGFLLMRNDLAYGPADAPRPVLVHQAIDDSPGLELVARFGPDVGGSTTDGVEADQGLEQSHPALEVYRVQPSVPPVQAIPVADSPRVLGGSESLLAMDDAGVFRGLPATALGARDDRFGGPLVVTDGLARRDRNFGQIDDSTSGVLAATEPSRSLGSVPDYLPPDAGPPTTARYLSAQVTASSSASDVYALDGSRPYEQPYAGVDGSIGTQWVSNPGPSAVGQWLELTFPQPIDVAGATLRLGVDPGGAVPTTLTVSGASQRFTVTVTNAREVIQLPDLAATRTLRVSLSGESGGGALQSFAIGELSVPGVHVGRTLVTPAAPAGSEAAAIVLTTADGAVTGCPRSGGQARCAAGLARPGEEGLGLDRTVDVGTSSEQLPVTAVVLPRPGEQLDRLIDSGRTGLRVSASSSSVADPAGRPQAAADDDLSTGWTAAAGDPRPTLTVTLPKPLKVSSLHVLTAGALAASPPASVHVSAPGLEADAAVQANGLVVLPQPVVTRSLSVSLTVARPVQSETPTTGR